MTQNAPTECPFCGFVPDVAKDDVKTAPEREVQQIHKHVEKKHPDRTDELPSYTSDQ